MKLIIILLMGLYLYVLTFGVFMTETFRIPAPFLFSFPLILLFRDRNAVLLYQKEFWIFIIATFCYYIIGLNDFPSFAANIIVITICLLYFSYFVGSNRTRFNYSILMFYLLLGFSCIVMVLNHFYPEINSLRELLMDEKVLQSPSGVATTQFTFGYQLAAFSPFVFLYTFLFHKPFFIKILVFLCCLIFIYFGMQRSVFITFISSVTLFLLVYYRMKAVFFITIAVFTSVLFYNYVLKTYSDTRENIVTKNEKNNPEHNRILLTSENLSIYADYPLGLIFYGKNWGDAIYRNPVFSSGITSHNAYLMFITYLGPFLGLGLLLLAYNSIIHIGYNALKEIRKKENALLVCMCFSFMAISLNALSHNAWLISADGPTVFLYFGILHLNKLNQNSL